MAMAYPNAGFLFNDTTYQNPEAFTALPTLVHNKIISAPDNGALVFEVEWCKCDPPGAEHEFLLCYLREAAPAAGLTRRRESVVLVERNAGDGPPAGTSNDGAVDVDEGNGAAGLIPTVHHPPPTRAVSDTQIQAWRSSKASALNSRSSLSSSSPSLSSFAEKSSGDAVVFTITGDAEFAKPREGGYKVAKILTFPKDSTFSLLQLLTLVHVVHSVEPNYTLKTFNCYWMARAIYKSLQEIVPSATDHTEFSPGKFHGAVHPSKDPHKPKEYVRKFHETWASVEAEINEARTLPQKRLEEERQGRMQDQQAARQREEELQKARQRDQEENRRLREQLAAFQNKPTSDPVMAQRTGY